MERNVSRKFGTTVELSEFNENVNFDDMSSNLLDEVASSSSSATGGHEVVDDQNASTRGQSALVHLDNGLAVFETIGDGFDGTRELAALASRDEGNIEDVSQRNAKVVST